MSMMRYQTIMLPPTTLSQSDLLRLIGDLSSFSDLAHGLEPDTAVAKTSTKIISGNTASNGASCLKHNAYLGVEGSESHFKITSRKSPQQTKPPPVAHHNQHQLVDVYAPQAASPQSVLTPLLQQSTHRRRHRVRFADTCEMRVCAVVLGDHPLCYDGCPLQLGPVIANMQVPLRDTHFRVCRENDLRMSHLERFLRLWESYHLLAYLHDQNQPQNYRDRAATKITTRRTPSYSTPIPAEEEARDEIDVMPTNHSTTMPTTPHVIQATTV